MLLDTQVVLWLLLDDDQMGEQARRRVTAAPAVHVSAASLWEISIKRGLGKLAVPDDLLDLIGAAGLQWLDVTAAHAWATQHVELPHRDPFDRLLLAQAAEEGMALVTADRVLLSTTTGVRLVDARL